MGPQEPPRDGTPGVDRDAFHCPNCGAYAAQHWGDVYLQGTNLSWPFPEWRAAKCSRCDKPNVWRESNLIWPPSRLGVRPHPDMPDDVRVLYEEAQDVSGVSKKSAAALLRLALQVLVDELERGNENLDKKIGKLVARGLDPGVQQAMDVVRVVGNNAVHPGQIDLESDDGELTTALFGLLNLIVEQVVSRPKRLAELFGTLPPGALEGIARRDGGNS